MSERFLVVAAALLTIGAGVWLLRPLVQALAERLRPQAVGDGSEAFRDEVLYELQQVRREVAELGERVDFAERLLAKQRAPEELRPG